MIWLGYISLNHLISETMIWLWSNGSLYLVGGLVAMNFIFPYIFWGMSSSQLMNSYFSEGWPNHQPPKAFMSRRWADDAGPSPWRRHRLGHRGCTLGPFFGTFRAARGATPRKSQEKWAENDGFTMFYQHIDLGMIELVFLTGWANKE